MSVKKAIHFIFYKKKFKMLEKYNRKFQADGENLEFAAGPLKGTMTKKNHSLVNLFEFDIV